MTTRPLPEGLRADVERHPDAVAGVVAGPPDFRDVPARTEIARAPLAIGFETASREHNGFRADLFLDAVVDHAHALHTAAAANQCDHLRVVTNVDAVLLCGLVLRLHETATATRGLHDRAAEELELAFVLERVAAEARHEAHAP